jgi:hypothetical protein
MISGDLTAYEHDCAAASARNRVIRTERYAGTTNLPYHCAATAAKWSLNRDAPKAFYRAIIWTAACEPEALRGAAIERLCDAFDARKVTK